MKLLILLLLSTLWLSGFTQDLTSNPWYIDQIIGRDTNKIQEFNLQKIDTTREYWTWGKTIRFFPGGNFICRYGARCGNDCFPSSNGMYQFSDSSHITIYVKEYDQNGYCENIHRTIDRIIGTYLIDTKDGKSIKLIKQR